MADRPGYKVGYGKPPKEHQFKRGQSGNPAGRKKGARGLKTDLSAELDAQMTIRINNEPVNGTRQRLLLRALTSRAATGDVRATAVLLPLIIQILGIEDRGGERKSLSPQDQAILDELLAGASPTGVRPTECQSAARSDGNRSLEGPSNKQKTTPDTDEERGIV